jgi:membrane-bound lytic murein transglycosylase A
MSTTFHGAGRLAGTILGTLAAGLAALLVACSSTPVAGPATPGPARPEPARGAEPPAADDGIPTPLGATLVRPRSRWLLASWNELPGWSADRVSEAMPALLRSCERPAPGWAAACAAARRDAVALLADDALGPRLARGKSAALARRVARGRKHRPCDRLLRAAGRSVAQAAAGFRVALYAPPADLASRKPYWTRQQLDTLPAARRSIAGSEIAWLRDPLDALLLQVQGSGRLSFVDEQDRPRELVRMAYAAHNDQPYKSVGRWLVEQGELRLEQASWPAIRAWAKQHPRRVDEMLWANRDSSSSARSRCPTPRSGRRARRACRSRPGARSRSTR